MSIQPLHTASGSFLLIDILFSLRYVLAPVMVLCMYDFVVSQKMTCLFLACYL